MKRKYIIYFILFTILIVTPLYADLKVTVEGNMFTQLQSLGLTYLNDFTRQINEVWNNGATLTADAFAIANYSTSTTGVAKFDNLILGAMFSPTFATKAEAIQSGMKEGLAAAKGGAFNAGILFGISLGSSMDLLINGVYLPGEKYIKGMDKLKIISGGLKLRLNILGPLKAIGTGLDGLTISLSGGYSRINISYSQALNARTEYNLMGVYNGVLTFDTFGGDANVNSIYAAVDIKIYFRVLGFLGIFGGAALIWDKSIIDISINGTGSNYISGIGTSTGSVKLSGDTTSSHFIPNIMLGVCFNIAFIKIPIQLSMTWSPKNNESTPIWNLTGGVLFNF